MNYIKIIIITFLVDTSLLSTPKAVIMIDPAGHAKNPGRTLHKNYARSETFACAQMLKQALEKRYHSIKVILTRAPGETIVPLQNASFANRSHIDLFLHIDFYKHTEAKPIIQPLHFISDPLMDYAKKTHTATDIIPLNHAHRQSAATSKTMAHSLKQHLDQTDTIIPCSTNAPQGLPIKPLYGIQAPALALDIGLTTDDQWNILIEPLVDALGRLLYTKPQ